jgi:hypothetical protein
MSRLPALLLLVVAAALLWAPEASACSVCFDASDENRWAFIGTTIFLSLLPVGMAVWGALWLKKRLKQIEEQERAELAGSARS